MDVMGGYMPVTCLVIISVGHPYHDINLSLLLLLYPNLDIPADFLVAYVY